MRNALKKLTLRQL